MPSPSRKAIERYEARILAYEPRRDSRADPGPFYIRPAICRPGRDASTKYSATARPSTFGDPPRFGCVRAGSWFSQR